MHIMHVALGGCLTWPAPRYGMTPDTGGHIAYVLGAALAQARRPDTQRVDIVTRAFDAPQLGADHAKTVQQIAPGLRILRLRGDSADYLAKEGLEAELPALTRAFSRLIAGEAARPDVIHTHFADAFEVVHPAARAAGIPVLYTPHSLALDRPDGAAPDDPRLLRETRALREADAVVVSSADEASRQVAAYRAAPPRRVHTVPPGATLGAPATGTTDARALVEPRLIAPEKPLILAIARPMRRKNLSGLARAWAADNALRDRANLVILAGQRNAMDATDPEVMAERAALDAVAAAHPGQMVLPAQHDPIHVPQLYRLARERGGVFVNPALHEPFGLTVLEAAQAGLPVIATRFGGPADVIAAIRHGRCVDPGDAQGMAAAISTLLSDRNAWRRASRAGPLGVRRYDWDAWAEQVARLAGSLVAGRRQRGTTTATAITRHPAAGRPRHLLACDIDGTLTGDRAAARRFADWAAQRDMPFAVATGRDLDAARAVLALWSLPQPDIWITAVGTEVHRPDATGQLVPCPDYAARLDADWDRAAVLRVLRAGDLTLQPETEQRRWKLAAEGSLTDAARLEARLSHAGLRARVVHSHGRFIDVLAPHGGKAAAIAHVAEGLGIPASACIAAGDSGNDRDMLTGLGHAIVVGNALPELDDLPARTGLIRTRAPHADGVLEGLARLGHVRTAREMSA